MIKTAIDHRARARVIKNFNRAATSYQEAAFLQQEIASRLLDALNSISLSAEHCRTLLDLGAGCGMASDALHQHYPRADIISVDIAWRMLAVAKQHYVADYVHWVAADGLFLPLATASVNVVWANQVVHWIQPRAALFREIERVLKPVGYFIFSTMGPDTLHELRNSWQSVDNAQHVNTFADMHDVGDDLLRVGFVDPVMTNERLMVTYASLRALMKDLKASGVGIIDPEPRRGLFGKQAWQQLQRQYEKRRLADSQLPVTYEVIYGCGKKKALS